VEAIPRLNVEDGAELRVAHTETHSWSIDVTGTIWARKRVTVTGIEGLLAEAVSWLLARRLRIPVPDAAVTLSGDLSWLSKQITPVVHWDAIHQGGITNLMDLGKVLVLDVLINNPDRHAGNLLLQPDPDESPSSCGQSTRVMPSLDGRATMPPRRVICRPCTTSRAAYQ